MSRKLLTFMAILSALLVERPTPLESRAKFFGRAGRPTSAALATLFLLSSSLGVGSLAQAAVHSTPSARTIVEKADRIRFPQEAFQVDVSITTTSNDGDSDVRKYRVLSKGNERTLVLTTAPAQDRGQILLMRDEDLWMFMPSVSQAIRLPLSQRLTGQVANGDLARANFAGDYHPTLLRTDSIDGKSYYVLELIAAHPGVTYHRVLYWVNEKNYRPYKAQFYTVSRHLLKTAYYQHFEEMEGAIRPTRILLVDALRKNDRSVMDYANMKLRDLSDKVFTKQYLKYLQ